MEFKNWCYILNQRQRQFAKTRAIIAWLCTEFQVAKIGKVADYFGRDITTLSRALANIIKSESNIQELEKITGYLKNEITQA